MVIRVVKTPFFTVRKLIISGPNLRKELGKERESSVHIIALPTSLGRVAAVKAL